MSRNCFPFERCVDVRLTITVKNTITHIHAVTISVKNIPYIDKKIIIDPFYYGGAAITRPDEISVYLKNNESETYRVYDWIIYTSNQNAIKDYIASLFDGTVTVEYVIDESYSHGKENAVHGYIWRDNDDHVNMLEYPAYGDISGSAYIRFQNMETGERFSDRFYFNFEDGSIYGSGGFVVGDNSIEAVEVISKVVPENDLYIITIGV